MYMELRDALQNRYVQQGMIAGAAGMGFVLDTVVIPHRERTHQSVTLNPVLDRAGRYVLSLAGVRSDTWAAVHTNHHGKTDADFAPMIQAGDLLDFRDEHPELDWPELPERFVGLDPVAEPTPKEVQRLAGLARRNVKGGYEKPDSYTKEEVEAILFTTEPRYFYEESPSRIKDGIRRVKKFWNRNDSEPQVKKSPLDILREADIYKHFEVRDPHSPVLHRLGTLGVALHNVGLFGKPARHYEDRDNRPDHLKDVDLDKDGNPPKDRKVNFVVGNMVLSATLGIAQGERSPAQIAKNAALGGATAVAAYGIYIGGGNFINSYGHGGATPWRSFVTGKIKMLKDGTFAADAPAAATTATFGEGKQDFHHKHPEAVCYSKFAEQYLETDYSQVYLGHTETQTENRKPWLRWFDDPFGSAVLAAVNHGWGMKPGPQFADRKPGELRPDVPSEEVIELQVLRVKTAARWMLEQQAGHPKAA